MGRPSISERIAAVPLEPGVYLWKNAAGAVLYVGKAKQLRTRMRQYLTGRDERVKIPYMMEQVADFEYIVTASEHESLILEKNLINQYDPPFNVDYRDDKSYPYIALTKGDRFPALKYTREKHVPSTRYFGPYTDARAARQMIDLVRRIIPICSTRCAQWRELARKLDAARGGGHEAALATLKASGLGKPCFDYHVGLGPGPCCGACTEAEYADHAARIERFLSGNRHEFVAELDEEMRMAASELDFERAARLRRRIEVIETLEDKQRVTSAHDLDCDVVGFSREETITGVNVFVIREGSIIISNEFILDKGLDVPTDDLVETFLIRYYDEAGSIPHQVILAELPEDPDALAAWLTEKRASSHGAKVTLQVPRRGERKELLRMAEVNAMHALMRFKMSTRYDEERINQALLQLESALALPAPPLRVECFDISTIHGRHSVASMVVFSAGRGDRGQYRRFKMRLETDEANDVAMMREVISRRYAPERMADGRFGSRPDLIVVDGGKPQLNATRAQLAAMGLSDIPLVGLAKADEELFVTWDEAPVVLPSGSAGLYLVKSIRDEAHRFAITYHRELRGKAMTVSLLDTIDGVGPTRRKALLRQFGSLRALRTATLEEIAAVKGLPRPVAEAVFAELHSEHGDTEEQATGLNDDAGGE
jgi:excinuclease ABC subunit C